LSGVTHLGIAARVDTLVPLLRMSGAVVDIIHAEVGLHRLDTAPSWDIVVLKSGTAAAESWGIPCLNPSDATRLAQDKLASTAILQRAGLPIAPAYLAWLDPAPDLATRLEPLSTWAGQRVLVKAARGSQGMGLWSAGLGELPDLLTQLAAGPYVIMEYLPHHGDDLKVFVAGAWMAAIERPFPATTYTAKLGHPVQVPKDVAEVTRTAGESLGLTCFGCDFINTSEGWRLIDINAFPGYKGVPDAALAVATQIARVVQRGTP